MIKNFTKQNKPVENAKLKNSQKSKELLEQSVMRYKKGHSDLAEASAQIERLSGLQSEIVACFLKAMKRNNLVELKGITK